MTQLAAPCFVAVAIQMVVPMGRPCQSRLMVYAFAQIETAVPHTIVYPSGRFLVSEQRRLTPETEKNVRRLTHDSKW
jgi:hypothetical protein